MSASPHAFRRGTIAAIPIALGYFPIAFSFGVAAAQIGLAPAEAAMLSLLIYAGAAQFMALALIAAGAPALVTGLTLIAMNLRHLLYGPVLMREAQADRRPRHAWAWGWGLTDEVFAQALGTMARGGRFSEPFMFGLGLPCYASWVGGTAIGALAGAEALDGYPALAGALEFLLPALFLSLLLSMASRRAVVPVAVAAAVTLAGTLALSATAGILLGMVTGALAGAVKR